MSLKPFLFATCLSILPLASYAQSYTENEAEYYAEPTISFLESIEISSLVDQMERDGVKTRKFGIKAGAKGAFIHYFLDYDSFQALSYEVKLTTDEKVKVILTGLNLRDIINTETGNTTSIKLFSFVMDKGVDLRDVKTMKLSIISADVSLGIGKNLDESVVLSLELGADVSAFGKQEVTLDNGQKILIGQSYIDGTNEIDHELIPMGFSTSAGLSLRQELKSGTLKLSTKLNYEKFGPSSWDPEVPNYTNRQMLSVNPGVSYSTRLGKNGAKIELGAEANVSLLHSTKGLHTVDLGDRFRQPVTVKAKITLGKRK